MNDHNLADIQRCIRFALDLEKNEETMADEVAMDRTCRKYKIEPGVGAEWLAWLMRLDPQPWWCHDDRLKPRTKQRLQAEWDDRRKAIWESVK